ncbi:Predicted nucleic acid-binding protein, contains PIN domain [Nonomuraea solani]|uniref:Predicted nucleic acid-binding protein, contains PIN domain n=1 Tax=Nonomuraea solani TaxID=1144553 RepID=A0A1H5SVV9_9ACTN|nr:PIN domain-containing protein [Nonomuraea solani]SEF54068.1 Predicted nucleic acid-binding protein, contains PIN domain [Nonomuraea solani]
MTYSVVLDTRVLYPAYLRDTLLRLAEAGLFRPLWSADILDELDRNLIRAGIPAQVVRRLVAEMRLAFEDAEVIGYQPLIPTVTCDEKDRHVLAAGVCVGANALVTFNAKDFPADSREPYDIELLTPDIFLLGCWMRHPELSFERCASKLTATSAIPEPYRD